MPPCLCSFNPPPSPSISSFISSPAHTATLNLNLPLRDLSKIHGHLIKTGLIHHHPIAASRLIRAYSRTPLPHLAIHLFVQLLLAGAASARPDRLPYPSLFSAYSHSAPPHGGAQLHATVLKLGFSSDPFTRNSVIHMYANSGLFDSAWKIFYQDSNNVVACNSMIFSLAKRGRIDESWKLFCNMPCRNEVSWNTMITSFVRNGMWIEALDLFRRMQNEDITVSEHTLVSALHACAKLGAFEQGKWIHRYIERNSVESNVILATAIIDMYSKCGDIDGARRAFASVPRKDKGLSCWNSMVLGFATNGCESEAFDLFSDLESCFQPDSVSFVAVLTASNHAGRVDKAKAYFCLMTETYKIEPTIQHYGCMVDALGRAGLIREAEEFVRAMPVIPDEAVWGSLLSAACKSHENIDVAEWAAQNLIRLNPDETSAHVLISRAHTLSGDFETALRKRMTMERAKKQPGCSLIEVNGEVHEFVSGGIVSPENKGKIDTIYF
ncbi:pentatricopeptide repeat-containing protein At2g42920, chloroplastic [Andrographis paniculata]|uniref:pentatricopeptide repeat-containing protein At2g42920, chloroplastic n=1 Tax=Andrographis paniculata TaxID=175694 RepID=UPI0021E6DC35|nr:pentatricopeptide repeat-containing protein At2g42920, chloroplastic [Andrographis paniculata]